MCSWTGHVPSGNARSARARAGASSESGFTLMEVVVALAILGTGLVVLLEAHYSSLRLFADAQERAITDTLFVGAVGMVEQSVLVGENTGAGDFGLRYPDYSWSYTSKSLNANNFPGLVEVTLTMRTPTDEEERIFLVHDGRQNADTTETRQLLRR